MAKVSFFSVLMSNLKCAVCKEKKCPVRFFPERKSEQYYDGRRFVTKCEKDRKAHEDAIFKKKLP